jgi:hypothetical protein
MKLQGMRTLRRVQTQAIDTQRDEIVRVRRQSLADIFRVCRQTLARPMSKKTNEKVSHVEVPAYSARPSSWQVHTSIALS